jgi:6-phosphogluconolactonase
MIRRPLPEDSSSYGLEGEGPPAPPLPGRVVVAPSVEDLVDQCAAEIVAQSLACVRRFGDFHLALSGGTTPQPLYEQLMYDPDCRRIPWMRTHLWEVDERVVPAGDPRSNFRRIQETIVDHSGIPPEQVHPIPVERPDAAEAYERTLRDVLEWRGPGEDRLDFVLLGMGADGHTASLFPASDVLEEDERLVRAVTVPPGSVADPRERVTMTYPLINASRFIAILVTGSSKAGAVQRVATGLATRDELPIKGVRPARGELKWFLDREAAGG